MSVDLRPIRRALISVSDKTGLEIIAPWLGSYGVEIYSTGGTAEALRKLGVAHGDISQLTGFPEIMDGRVKTLHPNVHGGILAKQDDATHRAAIDKHGIKPFDLIIVNLYPFMDTVKRGADAAACIENIDIGGPAMIRAAAKNHDYITIITDPADYKILMEHMGKDEGQVPLSWRKAMAQKAFALTARYDTAIANWMGSQSGQPLPEQLLVTARRKQILRYGENPQQMAAFYADPQNPAGLAAARQVQGKELSYNNLLDSDAAMELVSEFDQPSVAIIKHANPCGVASGKNLTDAYLQAFACDPTSAFGGIIACNRKLDAATASEITKIFTEVVIAPDADADAIAIFAKKTNLRLLLIGTMPDAKAAGDTIRSIGGGFLLQSRDNAVSDAKSVRVVTKRTPSEKEMCDLLFAEKVCKHVKSNAIVYAKDLTTIGIGAGQMSRIDSARIAKIKAAEYKLDLSGSVAASDAFFPFADGLEVIAAAGVSAIIQPGGSVRDQDVIDAADKAGLSMVFTGMRHFRH